VRQRSDARGFDGNWLRAAAATAPATAEEEAEEAEEADEAAAATTRRCL
jgi:hypothetical protein